jgi:hypothetical protein
LGLSGIRSTQRTGLRFVIKSEAEGPAVLLKQHPRLR